MASQGNEVSNLTVRLLAGKLGLRASYPVCPKGWYHVRKTGQSHPHAAGRGLPQALSLPPGCSPLSQGLEVSIRRKLLIPVASGHLAGGMPGRGADEHEGFLIV